MHEHLEARLCLSAYMSGNILYGVGTPEDDVITFDRDGKDIVVEINGEASRFRAASILKIISGGGDGNDRIDARSMRVRTELYGGNGDDTVLAGKGDDYACASYGNDVIRGGGGNDLLCGRVGDDTVAGGAGNDTITGDEGADVVSGGSGNDLILGGSLYKDPVAGSPDVLSGGAGFDTAVRNADADVISADDVEDVLAGDAQRYPYEVDPRLLTVRAVTKERVTSLKFNVGVASGAYTVRYGKVRIEDGVITLRALGYQDARYAGPPQATMRGQRIELGRLKPGKYRLHLMSRGDATIQKQVIVVG